MPLGGFLTLGIGGGPPSLFPLLTGLNGPGVIHVQIAASLYGTRALAVSLERS